jgi:sulfite reductase alpha subunit-like flavoprotein
MTAESSDRTVIHVELDVADSGMRFNAGDAVGVLPQNAAPLVTGLLARLGLDGDTVFEVQPASGEQELWIEVFLVPLECNGGKSCPHGCVLQ